MIIRYDWENEVVDRGPKQTFTHKGKRYRAWTRLYGDGTEDVEVELIVDPEGPIDDEVYEYASNLFLFRGDL